MKPRLFVLSLSVILVTFAAGCAGAHEPQADTDSTESELASAAPLFEYKMQGGFTRYETLDVKVAKSGAFTKANTSCSMSMMLLKRVAA